MKKISPEIALFHGSPVQVPVPKHGKGNPCNDYGLGFYCTEQKELACEWACPVEADGFVNCYVLATGGLSFVDLDSEGYGTLAWMATLVANRRFDTTTPLMDEAKSFLLECHAPDLSQADVVSGYRADDSYFSFARAFLDNRISLRQLERALRLGNLGKQVVAISPRAFDALSFVGAEAVDASLWHARRCARDGEARRAYRKMTAEHDVRMDDLFVLDLMREAGWRGLKGGA